MRNSIDFYKGIFLHVIPVRIIVPCLETSKVKKTNVTHSEYTKGLLFASILCCSGLQLWVGYFIYFKCTGVFFYLMFLMDVL